MTSVAELPKLPAADGASKDHRLIGGKAHPATRKVVDRAALELNQDRSTFMVTAGFEKAIAVLGPDTVRTILAEFDL